MNATKLSGQKARRFRHLFKKTRLTQENLARLLQVTPQTIWNWKNGKSPIPLTVLYFLEAFGVGE